jgi:hypothetical protein
MTNAVQQQIAIQSMSVGMAHVKKKLDGQGENHSVRFMNVADLM